ncbi:hypothetical protein ACW4FP_14200 [Paenarthrobacter ureafaciens]|uniref:hypothetical protein n=1 Tax=Paenarthrobacter sp. PAE-2 TaxID=2982532 RepID=UPI0022321B02|nr:hypothetical protein [Paenarthrobacter sp. PAE-2]MCW3765160.1 hypothetical protein [Paenarthrobacter sp. PAE-2]
MSQTPPRPLPAGRHFKRRRFNFQDPSAAPRTAKPLRPERSRPARAAVQNSTAAETPTPDQQQFKRRVALVIVTLVVLAVPVLLAALILAG